MATEGTPDGGLDEYAERMFGGADFTLIAYTNAADSLGPATEVADLAEPTVAAGYAPILLDGTWTSVAGEVTYTHPSSPHPSGFPGWTASGAWSAPVNGVAMVYGTRVIHFRDLDTPFVASNLRKLYVDLANLVAP